MPWIHFNLTTGAREASSNDRLDDADLAALGRGQAWSDVDNDWLAVDVSQNPPVVIQLTPPPEPSPAPVE